MGQNSSVKVTKMFNALNIIGDALNSLDSVAKETLEEEELKTESATAIRTAKKNRSGSSKDLLGYVRMNGETGDVASDGSVTYTEGNLTRSHNVLN